MAFERLFRALGRIHRTCLIVIVLSVIVAGAARAAQQPTNRPGGVVVVKAAEIKWEDYPGRPGVKLAVLEGDLSKPGPFLMRVKFPAGFKLAPHTHPSLEHT